MKIRDSFVTHSSRNDYMMIDAAGEFSGIVHSNATTAFIVSCLRTETTREEIIAKMLEKYDAEEDEIAESVDIVLETLTKIGAIVENN